MEVKNEFGELSAGNVIIYSTPKYSITLTIITNTAEENVSRCNRHTTRQYCNSTTIKPTTIR